MKKVGETAAIASRMLALQNDTCTRIPTKTQLKRPISSKSTAKIGRFEEDELVKAMEVIEILDSEGEDSVEVVRSTVAMQAGMGKIRVAGMPQRYGHARAGDGVTLEDNDHDTTNSKYVSFVRLNLLSQTTS
jgi:hypothetical protein